jgi:hypothetical protein
MNAGSMEDTLQGLVVDEDTRVESPLGRYSWALVVMRLIA